jgi:hypothetical protein
MGSFGTGNRNLTLKLRLALGAPLLDAAEDGSEVSVRYNFGQSVRNCEIEIEIAQSRQVP